MKTQFTKVLIASDLWPAVVVLLLAVSAARAQTPILCGQIITNSIGAPSEVDQYTYGGNSGETLTFGFVGGGPYGNNNCFYGYNAMLDLYNPTGEKITSLSHCGVRSTNLTLLASGTYTILVHDDDYAEGSSYALSIQSFTGGGCSSTPITCGQTISSNLTLQAEIDAFSYAGTAGQTVSVGFVGGGPRGENNCFYGYNATMDFYNPTGQKIASLSHCGVRSTNLTLAASGTYTMLVHDDDYAEGSMSYALSIQSFAGGGCSSTPIACGQTISSNLTLQAEIDAFSYTGTAGQTVSVGFVGGGPYGNNNCFYGYNAMLDLYNPTGEKITSLSHCGVRSTNLTLLASGTYTILVHDDDYAEGSSYALSIQSFTGGGCSSTPITCGQTISSNLTLQAEIDAFSYAGTAGQTVSVGFVGGGPRGENNCFYGYNATMDFYNPTGQKIASLSHCGVRSTNLTLAASGTYTMLVHDDDYAEGSMSYALSIQSFAGGGCSSTPIACGQTISSNLTLQAEIDAFSYTGTAGQTVSVGFVGGGPYGNNNCFYGYNAMLDLYNPTGEKITSLSHCGVRSTNLTLLASGTYTILVHDDDYAEGSSYALSIQSFTGGGCSSTPIACGQTVTANISSQAGVRAYGFGTSSGTVIFSFGGFSGAQFDLYDPAGNKLFTRTPGTATNITLAAGTFTLLVHDDDYSETGSYSFTTTCLPQCNYLISPTGASVDAGGTNGTVTVTVGAGCGWVATTNASWLRITSGSSGSGAGTTSYTVDANTSTNARVGAMTIANFTFLVNQAGVPAIADPPFVGDPTAAGNFGSSNGVYSITGSGEDIAGTADVFYFVHAPSTGNVQIVAHVTSLVGTNDPAAEVGVMMRETLADGSKHVFLRVDTHTNLVFRRRLAADDYSIETPSSPTNHTWLRLMRLGNTFIGHTSTNGLNWEYVWFTTVNMSSQVQVGIAVTAHHNNSYATATLDNVSIGSLSPLPGTWPLPGPKILLGGESAGIPELQRVGGFKFLVGGVVGDYFSIRSTDDVGTPFGSWPILVTVTNQLGVIDILDPQALTNPLRFYRAQRIGP